jgi:hypothetical protein
MDLRRSPGKRPYPEVLALTDLILGDNAWPVFDGWCASRGVEHEDLRWDRWLNLVYYFATRNASTEDKDKFDAAIAEHVAEWNMQKVKPVVAKALATAKDAKPERRRAPKPAWYGDDKTNTFNSKAAMATLTAPGVSGRKRGK